MNRIVLLALLALSACGGTLPPIDPPDPPQPTVEITVVVCEGPGDYCLKRPMVGGASVLVDGTATATTNDSGFARLRVTAGTRRLEAQREGYLLAQREITATAGFHQDLVLTRATPPLSRLRADGRFFVNDGGTYRGLWTSALSLLAKPPPERAAFLDWAKATGFDGVRVFAGDLGWAGQTPASALANLPAVLEETRARGLYLYLVAITGSASGYNVEQYLADIAQLAAGYPHAVVEVANEIGHGSQSALVNDPRALEQIAVRVIPSGQLWALGAMLGQDEPIDGAYPPTGVAPFSTAHLSRERPRWDNIRRIREIEAISAATGKPSISGEPIGCSDIPQPGRRESDPQLFYGLGILSRLFELGATVFHSDSGLMVAVPSPVQQSCADAFVAGFKKIATTNRLTYMNTGWIGSPVLSADFSQVTRVYSGVNGSEGWTVAVGVTGDPKIVFGNGWSVKVEERPHPELWVFQIGR